MTRRNQVIRRSRFGTNLDDYALTAQLKAHPLTAHMPIVILSAHAYPEYEERARESNCVAALAGSIIPD